MDIKSKIISIFIYFLLISNGLFYAFRVESIAIMPDLRTSDAELPNKVYTFLAFDGNLTFSKIELEKYYNYYIYVEVVTPHNCTIRITIWDPENKEFNIFENELCYTPSLKRYYEIPFGTSLGGQYRLEFLVSSLDNLNIFIKIEKGEKCLYDKISTTNDLIFYDAKRVFNNAEIVYNIMCKTDMMYSFYIARLSAITIKESNKIEIDFDIESPNNVKFILYDNHSLAPINSIDKFSFGTSVEGLHTISIKVRSKVKFINLGYCVIEDYQISKIKNGSIYDNSSYIRPVSNTSYIPKLLIVSTGGVLIGIFIIPLIIFIIHRKKNNLSLNLNRKEEKSS